MKYLLILSLLLFTVNAEEKFGKLIFQDDFERSESQEKKDELGNDWTTSSDRTAEGNKQVDLRDGHMYISTHKVAWHATSVRHTFEFKDGTLGLKVMFDDTKDSLRLNFTDLKEKSVHAGHLFHVTLSPTALKFDDLKTGRMNLEIVKARKSKTLTNEQKAMLSKKTHSITNKLETKKWHQIYATVKGDVVTCTINGKLIGSFKSPGIAHESKSMIRLLVDKNAHVDEVRVWRNN